MPEAGVRLVVPMNHCWLVLIKPANVDPLLWNVCDPEDVWIGEDIDVLAVNVVKVPANGVLVPMTTLLI